MHLVPAVERGTIGLLQRGGVLAGRSPLLKDLANTSLETETPFQSLLIDRAKEKTAQLRLTEFMVAPHGAAMTANVITYRDRSAMRDMGRVLVVVLAIYGILKFEDLYHREIGRAHV